MQDGKKLKSRATVINNRIDSFITDTLQLVEKSQVSGKLSMGDISGNNNNNE